MSTSTLNGTGYPPISRRWARAAAALAATAALLIGGALASGISTDSIVEAPEPANGGLSTPDALFTTPITTTSPVSSTDQLPGGGVMGRFQME